VGFVVLRTIELDAHARLLLPVLTEHLEPCACGAARKHPGDPLGWVAHAADENVPEHPTFEGDFRKSVSGIAGS
jgi:hypothetical protein